MTCTLNNVTQNIKLNVSEEDQSSNINEPVTISRPSVTYAHDKHRSEEINGEHKGVEQIDTLIKEYADISSELPTQTNVYEHRIKVTDPSKFVRRTYPIPMKYEEQVEKEIRRMLDNDVVERSNSNFLNPLVVVKKKNDEIRLCSDMRNLNSVVEKDFDCAPTADELFTKCEGAKYLTKLDLTSSSWQISIIKSDRKYTAFMYKK